MTQSLKDFVNQISQVIWKAPIATVVTWGLLTYGSFLYLRSQITEQMGNLQSANDTRQATIQFQDQRIADLQDRLKNNGGATQLPPTPQQAKIENKYVCTTEFAP